MTRPTRILHVVGGMNRGGVETWLMNVLRHIDRDRYQMDFLVHTNQPCAYDDEIRRLGSRIIPCSAPTSPIRYGRNFRYILRDYGPFDVLHSHVYLFSALPIWIAARSGIRKRIAHLYPLADQRDQTARRRLYTWFSSKMIARDATMILADSHASLRSWQSQGVDTVDREQVLYCGIDIAPFRHKVNSVLNRHEFGLPIDKPVVIYVARFVPHKNHDQLFRVADIINATGYLAHFVIVGTHGPERERIENAATKRVDVSVLTNLAEVAPILMSSDVFFFPSLEEGFGLVALEACAAGLPVVATGLPTIAEACPPGHRELMFLPNDDEDAAESLKQVLTDGPYRAALAREGREWVERFPIDHSVDALCSVYQQGSG